jgi:MarR-like DNA-binding transcriptional regulator SgrR of sgrS sRNA
MPAGVRLDEIRPSDAARAAQQRQKETAELQKAVMKMKAEDDARRAEKEQRMREGMERLKMQEAQKQNDDALQRKAEFERLQATVAQQEKANAEAARVLMLEAGRLKQVRADNERRMFEDQAQKDMMVWEANEVERRRLAEEKQKLLAQQRSVCIDPGDVCIH